MDINTQKIPEFCSSFGDVMNTWYLAPGGTLTHSNELSMYHRICDMSKNLDYLKKNSIGHINAVHLNIMALPFCLYLIM